MSRTTSLSGQESWQCPYCERTFVVPMGLSPEMCDACSSAEQRRASNSAAFPENTGPVVQDRPRDRRSATAIICGLSVLLALVVYGSWRGGTAAVEKSIDGPSDAAMVQKMTIAPQAAEEPIRSPSRDIPTTAVTQRLPRILFPAASLVAMTPHSELDRLFGTPASVHPTDSGGEIRSYFAGSSFADISIEKAGQSVYAITFDKTDAPRSTNEALQAVGIEPSEMAMVFNGPNATRFKGNGTIAEVGLTGRAPLISLVVVRFSQPIRAARDLE